MVNRVPCWDMHSDYGWHLDAQTQPQSLRASVDELISNLRKGKVSAMISQVGGDYFVKGKDFRRVEHTLASFQSNLKIINQFNDRLYLIREKNDLEKAELDDGRTGILFSLEGAASIDIELTRLHQFYEMGLRSLIISQNKQNQFASGCIEPVDTGLTEAGRNLVAELESKGIIMDLSHISEKSYLEALDIYTKPVIVSHSNVKAICPSFRNLTDEQILKLGENGGIIGVTFVAPFVDANPKNVTIDRVIDHIDYLEKLIGVDHVGLGADFIDYIYEDIRNYLVKYKLSMDGLVFPECLQNAGDFQNIFVRMEEHGYSKADIRKIAFDNFFQLAQKVLS